MSQQQDYADGRVVELTVGAAELNPILESASSRRQLVLLDFFATWCGPCRMLAPVLAQLAQEFRGRLVVVKLDCEKSAANQELAAQSNISAYPTLKFFRDKAVIATLRGADPRALRETITQQLAQLPQPKSFPQMSTALATALHKVKASCKTDEEFQTAAKTLIVYVKNILNTPNDPKYRKIKLSSNAYQSRLGSKAGGKDCLLALGFQETIVAMEPILQMEDVPDQLEDVIRLLEQAMNSGGAAAPAASGGSNVDAASLTQSLANAMQGGASAPSPSVNVPPPAGDAVPRQTRRVVVTPAKLAKALEAMMSAAGFVNHN